MIGRPTSAPSISEQFPKPFPECHSHALPRSLPAALLEWSLRGAHPHREDHRPRIGCADHSRTVLRAERIDGMTGLALTPERRTELAALLDDGPRLTAEYPKVAEYLDTAPMLSGTGDPEADGAFDLRFVHFMTGGTAEFGNPYWEIVGPAVGTDGERRVINGGSADGSVRLGFVQTILQAAYAYAIPSPETLEWVQRFSQGRTVVELGAGRGYWARQLSDYGMTVEAFDSEPPDTSANLSFPDTPGQPAVWFPVGGPEEFATELDADSVLFLCWPPGWGNTMASEALKLFESRGGSRLVFIGEPKGGKTGDDAFFDRLSAAWSLESADERFVSWWNLTDVAQGWVRRP